MRKESPEVCARIGASETVWGNYLPLGKAPQEHAASKYLLDTLYCS